MNSIKSFIKGFEWYDFFFIAFLVTIVGGVTAGVGAVLVALWTVMSYWVVVGPACFILVVLFVYYVMFYIEEKNKDATH